MSLSTLRGRVLDLDSHLQLKADVLRDVFGDALRGTAADTLEKLQEHGLQMRADAEDWSRFRLVKADEEAWTEEEAVWNVKGPDAPGAGTPEGRLQSLDLMGIDRQLIFPMVVVGYAAWMPGPQGPEVMRRYNDFVLDWTKAGRGRLRPTGLLATGDVDLALAEARRVIDAGVRALLLPTALLGDKSPADPVWDPLWTMLEEANVPALLHIGGELNAKLGKWRPPQLVPKPLPGGGELLGPYELMACHQSAELFITALVLGGVFERHPGLRLGAIELGAQWVGPLADMLDERVNVFSKRFAGELSLKPSEYLARQFRVTPFFWERVERYIEVYGLEDCYAFATDFPHPEGGTDPIAKLYDRLAPLGDDVVEKFFVENAKAILPD